MIRDSIECGKLITSQAPTMNLVEPVQYNSKQKAYYENESRMFVEQYAQFSSDFVEAQIQGLNIDEPFEYTTVHVRFADAVKPSSAMSTPFDNFKFILIAEKQYGYIRKGAKLIAMGNTWIVLNPRNMSGAGTTALVQRCDAVYHHLDFYGNVCKEPCCINNIMMRANNSDAQRVSNIATGYFNVIMQHNDVTDKLLDTNARMMLGSSVYRVTGYSDFIVEYTNEDDSVNLIEFTVRFEEFNDAIDDKTTKVAGGKTFDWVINISGTPTVKEGQSVTLSAQSIRSYGGESAVITSTDTQPVTYTWQSEDETVATVSSTGVVTGVSEGETTIYAVLNQNNSIIGSYDIKVEDSVYEPHVAFTTDVPESLSFMSEASVSAVYFDNGLPTQNQVTFEFSGADTSSYSTQINGNTAKIKCWGSSSYPLSIKASYNGVFATKTISLKGI